MATTATIEATGPLPSPGIHAAERSLYFVWVSTTICLIAIGGFIPTYWLQLPAGTFIGPRLIHIHAAVFTAWPLLLLSQSILASRGRLRNHRAWGMAGISLGTMLVMLGIATAIGSLQSQLGKGYDQNARTFIIVPLSSMVMFAGFFAAAIASVNRPEWHKRWMLLTTLSMMQAVIARFVFVSKTGGGPGLRPGLALPQPGVGISMSLMLADILLVAVILVDWRRCRRLHPAWLIGFAAIVAIQLGRIPLSASPAWQSFAASLAQF